MKQIKIFIAFIVVIFSFTFTACNSNNAQAKEPQTMVNENPPPTPETKPVQTEAEKAATQDFAFWANKVEVKPMVTNENDTWGEGQEPATTISYTFYFTDSTGNQKELEVNEALLKVKPAENSNDAGWYKETSERFQKAKKVYEEITKTKEGDIYVEGTGKNVKSVNKRVDLATKKIGTVTIKQDATVELWYSRY